MWHGYIKTMRSVGFDNATRLYVASGMLTYGASVDMDRTIAYLKHVGVCNEVHHKERYIPQSEIESELSPQRAPPPRLAACPPPASASPSRPRAFVAAVSGSSRAAAANGQPLLAPLAELNSEQKALLDFIVLARARRFVGFGSSTFSFYLREYRALQVRAGLGGGAHAMRGLWKFWPEQAAAEHVCVLPCCRRASPANLLAWWMPPSSAPTLCSTRRARWSEWRLSTRNGIATFLCSEQLRTDVPAAAACSQPTYPTHIAACSLCSLRYHCTVLSCCCTAQPAFGFLSFYFARYLLLARSPVRLCDAAARRPWGSWWSKAGNWCAMLGWALASI